MSDDESGIAGYLGTVVEYIRPTAALKEGSFESSAALEAGGDDMSDDENMGGEQMLYEGLTGGEADKIPSAGLADSVDAGGQGEFVDVSTMSSGNWESDDGTGIDVLVEPGQAQPAPQPAPRVDRASSYRTNDRPEPPVFRPASQNGNGNGASQNGASQSGSGALNGAHRNGAHRNGVVPRNRITAFDSAAPLIQGTGAATLGGPRGFSTTQPPNPAAFGNGLGQAPDPAVEFAKQLAATAGQVGTAVALSRTPPQYRPPAPTQGADLSVYQNQQQPPPAKTSVMPWVLGALGVSVVGFGIWYLTRSKKSEMAVQPQATAPATQPPVARNYPRRPKAVKRAKRGAKSKTKRR